MPSDQGKAELPILVVDDQPGVRLTLQGVLSKKGYHVSVAAAARLMGEPDPPPPHAATVRATSGITAALARKVMGLLRVMSLLRMGSIDSRSTRR